MMGGYSITEKQSILLNDAVTALAASTEARAVFLTDYSGNIIAYMSQSDDSVLQNIAALSAGSFCATRQLAELIGEPTFHSILHKGDKASIFIQSVTSDFLLLLVFGEGTTAGLVKLHTEKACRELEPRVLELVNQGVKSDKPHTFEMDDKAKPFKKRRKPRK
jgi:predicted regulator of Ras-like GTPase activity (Roadblock/LC7/MglB family)